MRLTLVSKQPFVGIDLPRQELELAPFALAFPVFCGLAEHPSRSEVSPILKAADAQIPSDRRGVTVAAPSAVFPLSDACI
jgi:hypothetical protein